VRTVFLDVDTLHLSDLDTTSLDQNLTEVKYWPDSTPDDIRERLQFAEVAVVNKVIIDSDLMRSSSHLKLIALVATGADNIDLAAAAELGIAVCNIRNYCTPAVVQHVFALILTLNQRLDTYRNHVHQGTWAEGNAFSMLEPITHELNDKTLGLIGLGALGSGVAGVARAFGMRVIAARLPWRSAAASSMDGPGAPRLPLDELLQQSDIVSLHCPLTDDTRHIIDARALEQMPSHALLINTARGGLVDSAALVAALSRASIGGAGIDVLAEEPPVSGDPLLDYRSDRLIVTPHMAWGARESRQRALDQLLENIKAFTRGQELRRLV